MDVKALAHQFAALPENRFALFDNRDDKIHLLNADGMLDKTLSMGDERSGHLQSCCGIVVDNTLIVSEDGRNRLLKVDLSTNKVSVFRDLSHLPFSIFITMSRITFTHFLVLLLHHSFLHILASWIDTRDNHHDLPTIEQYNLGGKYDHTHHF